ncbi:AAA family ATPase [Nonomuraea sp. NPDC050536]|uniref:AAA family ATPase n=1 Tax=Nonomuraea sp. NPDC050536 TaxID=3364366 RepID=UPI0037CC6B31
MSWALLINGTVGVGKTTVADVAGDLLAEEGVPNAVIDVDWLRRSWPSPEGDPFNAAITMRNLRAVAANFLDAGVKRLVLAGVIESADGRRGYEEALGVPLTVCWLRAPLDEVRRRLTRRHDGDDKGLRWHLDRSGELERVLERAAVEDYVVESTADPRQVAEEVLKGWVRTARAG